MHRRGREWGGPSACGVYGALPPGSVGSEGWLCVPPGTSQTLEMALAFIITLILQIASET